MRSMTFSEQKRLSAAVEHLSRSLSYEERPLGLKQRARSAFLKQLHAYKRAQLEALCGGPTRPAALEETESKRVARI